jgi:hypothetical protein
METPKMPNVGKSILKDFSVEGKSIFYLKLV